MKPSFAEEKKLWKQRYRSVACVDEAGRGPLAGPVVAAAVCFVLKLSRAKENLIRLSFPRLRDSKKLSPKRREEIYNKVRKHPVIQWGIGVVGEKLIDKINIYQATRLAMKRALQNMIKTCYSSKKSYIDFLILDGNMRLDVSIPQKAIVKADEKVFSCALASIMAKVRRDRIMVRYHKKYPQYGFDRHKGYGTPEHIRALRQYGPCFIHRKTFNPVSKMTNF